MNKKGPAKPRAKKGTFKRLLAMMKEYLAKVNP